MRVFLLSYLVRGSSGTRYRHKQDSLSTQTIIVIISELRASL